MRIDYVVPYVDDTDPVWRRLFEENSQFNKHGKKETSLRFAENKTFKYVFRGIEKHMPWVSDIILLVQSESQVPAWVNRNTVRVVTHGQFIPAEFLPTFNSCTIECFLHRIPGIAPLFVYGNDDMYVINDCSPEDFFEDRMIPLGTFQELLYVDRQASFHSKLCRNMTELACRGLNVTLPPDRYFVPKHGQSAYSTSVYRRIYDEFESEIRGSVTKFREEKNLSQYFFMVRYMLETGRRYEGSVPFKRFDIVDDFPALVSFMSRRHDQVKLLCLNNNDAEKDIILLSAFEKIFTKKSRYEV